ncbi:hypothetical protein ccbrp13_12470 [Ktedonobacteria bacterium brp13]|nr:hypothetical protein ccbrp13_12470 [Ktedonobacteria bacterium brp13]
MRIAAREKSIFMPLESEVISKESRLVRRRAIGKGSETIPRWWPIQPPVRFGAGERP